MPESFAYEVVSNIDRPASAVGLQPTYTDRINSWPADRARFMAADNAIVTKYLTSWGWAGAAFLDQYVVPDNLKAKIQANAATVNANFWSDTRSISPDNKAYIYYRDSSIAYVRALIGDDWTSRKPSPQPGDTIPRYYKGVGENGFNYLGVKSSPVAAIVAPIPEPVITPIVQLPPTQQQPQTTPAVIIAPAVQPPPVSMVPPATQPLPMPTVQPSKPITDPSKLQKIADIFGIDTGEKVTVEPVLAPIATTKPAPVSTPAPTMPTLQGIPTVDGKAWAPATTAQVNKFIDLLTDTDTVRPMPSKLERTATVQPAAAPTMPRWAIPAAIAGVLVLAVTLWKRGK